MRTLVLAVVALVLVVPSARADYLRLPTPKPDAGFALQGENVLVGAHNVLTSYAPDGTPRVIPLPKHRGELRFLNASDDAIGLELSVSDYVALNGKPWRKLGGLYVSSRVMGSKALITRDHSYDEGGSFDVLDLRTGARKHFSVAEERPVGPQVVGDYLAYFVHFAVVDRETLVVRRLSTGREVYRRRLGDSGGFDLLPGGRVIVATPGSYNGAWRIREVTRKRMRTIREVALLSGQLEATAQGIAIVRSDAQFRGDVWLLGYDGRMRPLTPRVAGLEDVEFNGHRLAFTVGDCVFTGLVPKPGALLPGVPADGCVRSNDGGAG